MGKARMFNCACPGRWTLISIPPDPMLVVGCCERRMVPENGKLLSDFSRSLLLLRIGPPPSSTRFFLSGMHLPGFKRFWHVLFEVGVSAFAPFGPLTAASGLARSHPAHVQGAASNLENSRPFRFLAQNLRSVPGTLSDIPGLS